MSLLTRVLALLLLVSAPAWADDMVKPHILGDAKAPIKVDEFVSLTCTHCADFYNNTLPELEKKYVDTGKVAFILHDFPIDGVSLKAAAVASCMPTDEYFPFVKTLFKSQMQWAFGSGDPVSNLIQYAKLGGLSEERAKACATDNKLLDAIIAERTEAANKYQIEATPTFIVQGGETIKGAQPAAIFAAQFDSILAAKK